MLHRALRCNIADRTCSLKQGFISHWEKGKVITRADAKECVAMYIERTGSADISHGLSDEVIIGHVMYYAGELAKADVSGKMHHTTRMRIVRWASNFAETIKKEHGLDLCAIVNMPQRRHDVFV